MKLNFPVERADWRAALSGDLRARVRRFHP